MLFFVNVQISCLVIGAVEGNVENTLVSVKSWLITECYSAFTGVKVSQLMYSMQIGAIPVTTVKCVAYILSTPIVNLSQTWLCITDI